MKSSFDGLLLAARQGLAENSELSQSRARILITVLAFIYLTAHYRELGAPGDPSWYAAVLVSIYLGAAIVWQGIIHHFPTPNALRKCLAITSDAAIVSVGLYLGGARGVVLYPVYFWIIAGNGLRFGSRYLLTALTASMVGMTVAVLASDYWREYLQVGLGLLVGMLLIAALLYMVVYRLHETNLRLQERVRESERLATHDHLTGLANRALFLARLEQELNALPRNRTKLGVLFIDLDGFKGINDAYGHALGDWLLIQVAGRLQTAVRRSDTVARIGGDEFAILLAGLHDRGQARAVADWILQALSEVYYMDGGQLLAVTPSIGLAVAPDQGDEADVLFHVADMAMYAVKRAGKGAVGEFQEGTGSPA